VLSIPRFGCLNIHASLLPRWRGAAPIQRAIAAGDAQTGIALMQMEEGLDTGPVWSQAAIPISPEDNFQTLHDRLAALGAQSVVALLQDFPPKDRRPVPQPEAGILYAHKITKDDTKIDWSQPASQVASLIRAFDPVPGALSIFSGEVIKLFSAADVSAHSPAELLKNSQPGQIIQMDQGSFLVACGQGAVKIAAIQRPGGKRLTVREFLNGRRVTVGQRFESVLG
jgi:methionyl-tRNA formyltransferase